MPFNKSLDRRAGKSGMEKVSGPFFEKEWVLTPFPLTAAHRLSS